MSAQEHLSRLKDKLHGLKAGGTFALWPCVYGGDQCLLVAMKEDKSKAVCVKAAELAAVGGRRRERLLSGRGCPHPMRKMLLGFTRGWDCRFADGHIHTLGGVSKRR